MPKRNTRPHFIGGLLRAVSLWFFVPIKVWPDIGAPLAARLTDETRLQIGIWSGHRSPLIAVELTS